MAGSAIYKLAVTEPELKVTGIIRNESKAREVLGEDAELIAADVFSLTDSTLSQFDVIVDAFKASSESANQQIELAKKLVDLARKHETRLIFILGAGSLKTGEDKHLFVDDIAKIPESSAWINTPRMQLKELEYLETVNDIDWLGISPSAQFGVSAATKYIIGQDELLFNDQKESKVTSGTMAKLVVSEILNPQHHRERITVVNTED